jgi:hypothetical protein
MRPTSKRALLEQLARKAPPRGARLGSALALIAIATIVLVHFLGSTEGAQSPTRSEKPAASAPFEGVLALPFGQGSGNAAAPTGAAEAGPIAELRETFRRTDDLYALFQQWRERPEADARYLAFRAARDCELLRTGGIVVELDALSERRGERERQATLATARCRGFQSMPPGRDEVLRIEQEAAAAGSLAAQVALTADTFSQRPVPDAIAVVRRALASGDQLAFDESRVLLAMSRHQVEIGGMPPSAPGDARSSDTRVVAIDLVGCRLGNPCGQSRGSISIDCGSNLTCQRDAEEWLMQMASLDDDEQRTTQALAARMLAAFKRGAIDEIVRMPNAQAQVSR